MLDIITNYFYENNDYNVKFKNNKRLIRRIHLLNKIKNFINKISYRGHLELIQQKKIFENRSYPPYSKYKSKIKKCTNSKNRTKNSKLAKLAISCYNANMDIEMLIDDEFIFPYIKYGKY